MEFCKGELVVGTAGREKDRFMCVVAYDGKYVYICDGKERPLERPKKKSVKHINRTDKKLPESSFKTDRALRKALSREV